MRTPAVLAAIHVEIGRRLIEDGALCRRVIMEIVKDADTPSKLRGELAIKMMDRAGHVAPRAKAIDDDAGKSLHELGLEDLRAQRDRLEAEIVGRARVIAPSVPAYNDETIDLLG